MVCISLFPMITQSIYTVGFSVCTGVTYSLDSNAHPSGYETTTLPTELQPVVVKRKKVEITVQTTTGWPRIEGQAESDSDEGTGNVWFYFFK